MMAGVKSSSNDEIALNWKFSGSIVPSVLGWSLIAGTADLWSERIGRGQQCKFRSMSGLIYLTEVPKNVVAGMSKKALYSYLIELAHGLWNWAWALTSDCAGLLVPLGWQSPGGLQEVVALLHVGRRFLGACTESWPFWYEALTGCVHLGNERLKSWQTSLKVLSLQIFFFLYMLLLIFHSFTFLEKGPSAQRDNPQL